MTSFEDYLKRCVRTDWSYMDYGKLKCKLKSFYERRHRVQQLWRQDGYLQAADLSVLINMDTQANYFQYTDEQTNLCLVDPQDALLRLAIEERKEFSAMLEAELVKVATFYSQNILVPLRKLVYTQNSDLKMAATELLEAMVFCVANVIAFRQVLIRYDAFRRTFDGMPLTEWHLQRSILASDHPVHAIFRVDDLESIGKTFSNRYGTAWSYFR